MRASRSSDSSGVSSLRSVRPVESPSPYLRLYVLHSDVLPARMELQSFITVSTLVATISEFSSLLLLNNLGLNIIPASPIALVFSILYQFSRIVPSIYHFRIFGIVLNNKSFTYLLAAQVRHPSVIRRRESIMPRCFVLSYPADLFVFITSFFFHSSPSQQHQGPLFPHLSGSLLDNSIAPICSASRHINFHHG